MVRQVVRPEGSTVRKPDRKVCKYGENTVEERRSESKIVGYFMDCQECVLVCCPPDEVGCDEETPRAYRGIP